MKYGNFKYSAYQYGGSILIQKILSEIISVTDVFSKSYTRLQIIIESILLSDNLTRSRFITYLESITISPIFSKVRNFFRTLTERIAIIDRIRILLNGYLAGLWTVKDDPKGTWTVTPDAKNDWNKEVNP